MSRLSSTQRTRRGGDPSGPCRPEGAVSTNSPRRSGFLGHLNPSQRPARRLTEGLASRTPDGTPRDVCEPNNSATPPPREDSRACAILRNPNAVSVVTDRHSGPGRGSSDQKEAQPSRPPVRNNRPPPGSLPVRPSTTPRLFPPRTRVRPSHPASRPRSRSGRTAVLTPLHLVWREADGSSASIVTRGLSTPRKTNFNWPEERTSEAGR